MRLPSPTGWGVALGFLMGFCVTSRTEGQTFPQRMQPKVITYQSTKSALGVVAIMGQVARPGTYQFAQAPTLQTSLETAGGPLPSASHLIRIVRGQREVQRVAFATGGQIPLQAGDLVIVDDQLLPPGVNKTSSADGVQIAFLGVLDYPVVVKVHTQEARPDWIVQNLGQSPDVLRSLRVLPAASGQPASPLLPDRTVLVFDRKLIVANQLQNMPEIIPCSANEQEEPDLGAYGVRNAYEERQSKNQIQPSAPIVEIPQGQLPPADILTQVPPPLFDDLPRPMEDRVPAMLSSNESLGKSSPPISTLPFSKSDRISTRASQSTRIPTLPVPSQAVDAQTPAWKKGSDSNSAHAASPAEALAQLDEGDLSAQKTAGQLSLWNMLGIVTAAGVVMGAALTVRALTERTGFGQQSSTARGYHAANSASFARVDQHMSAPVRSAPMPHIPMNAYAMSGSAPAAMGAREPLTAQREDRQKLFSQLVNRELEIVQEPLALSPGSLWSANEMDGIVRRASARPKMEANEAAKPIRQVDPPHVQHVSAPHLKTAQESPVDRALRQLQGGLS